MANQETPIPMSEKLARLTQTLPPAARGITVLVDREYAQIRRARKNGWPWTDIAEALDLPADKAAAIASAYARRKKLTDNGATGKRPKKARTAGFGGTAEDHPLPGPVPYLPKEDTAPHDAVDNESTNGL